MLRAPAPYAGARHVCLKIPFAGSFARDVFHDAFRLVLERHEVLRTIYPNAAEGTLADALDDSICIDYRDADRSELRQSIAAALLPDFDLARQIPIRALVLSHGGDEHSILLAVHHSAIDAWSIPPFADDLQAAYGMVCRRTTSGWPALPRQYRDYVNAERHRLGERRDPGSVYARQERFWRRALRGISSREQTILSVLERAASSGSVGFTAGGPPKGGDGAAVTSFRLEPAMHRQLQQVARDRGVSVFMMLHAALVAFLTGLGHASDIVIGTAVSGRAERGVSQLVGLFENAIALRIDTKGDPTFEGLLARVRRADYRAFEHQDLHIDVVLENTQLVNPLELMLVCDSGDRAPLISSTLRPGSSFRDRCAIAIRATEIHADDGGPGGIECQAEYRESMVSAGAVNALLAGVTGMLNAASAAPERSISRLFEQSDWSRCRFPTDGAASSDSLWSMPPTTVRPSLTGGPSNTLHYQLAVLWEKLLGIRPVTVYDSFVGLGGTPTLARRMVAGVKHLIGRFPSISPLSVDATIANLANAAIQDMPPTTIVEIHPGNPGVRPPLFYFHGDLGGAGLYVRALARELGADQPVYVVHAHGVIGDAIPGTVEEMAEELAAAISAHWPTGPCCVGGYCFGGAIAFEVARQLHEQGREVAAVILIEPSIGPDIKPISRPVLPLSDAQRRDPRARFRWVHAHHHAAVMRYCPRPYPGHVTMMLARERPIGLPDPTGPVQSVAETLDIRALPGDHLTVIGVHLQDIAGEISACLDAASDPGRRRPRRVASGA